MAKNVAGGILEWVKNCDGFYNGVAQMASGVGRACGGWFGRVFVCSRGVRGVCGLRIVDYIFLARIENKE